MYYGIDETGNKYSRLQVITYDDNHQFEENGWICLCDCGNIVTVRGRDLRGKRTKSCGCLNDERRRERVGRHGVATKAWKLPHGYGSFRSVLRNYKESAKHRNVPWDLNENDAHKLMRQNCFYCGATPNTIGGTSLFNGLFIYNGLDRFDNSRGYNIDNVVPCCFKCNNAKLDMTAEDFITWLLRASEYLRENIEPGSAR